MFSRLKKIIEQPDIAVDLGTANTRIDASELENITEQPSWIRHVYYNNEADVYGI